MLQCVFKVLFITHCSCQEIRGNGEKNRTKWRTFLQKDAKGKVHPKTH